MYMVHLPTFTTKNQLIVGKYIIEWMAWGKKSLKKALFPGRVLFFGGDRLTSAKRHGPLCRGVWDCLNHQVRP